MFAALSEVRLRAAEGTDPTRMEAPVTAAERFCVNLDTLRGGAEVATVADLAASDCG